VVICKLNGEGFLGLFEQLRAVLTASPPWFAGYAMHAGMHSCPIAD
jgi:hypothetical protein